MSVILPAHAGGAAMLVNTLRSYACQTASGDDFEVVVADDGGGRPDVKALSECEWPYPISYVLSPRVRGSGVAHKNHARNAGWQTASAGLCFICDCDCLVGPRFVEELLRAWEQVCTANGRLACLYPMIACLDAGHMQWLAGNGSFADEEGFDRFLAAGKVTDHFFGGNYEAGKLEAEKLVSPLTRHPEGYHAIPKELLAELGGFDEEFIGWGGNKQEFQDRINELPAVRKLLLDHCVVYHQPHGSHHPDKRAIDGYSLLNRRRSERKTSAAWARVRARVESLGAECPGAEPSDEGPLARWWRDGREASDSLAEAGADITVVKVPLRGGSSDGRPIAFFGPWIGEFGWEAARWQGGVREHARRLRPEHWIVAAGDPGHHPFYDEADEYWWTPAFFRRAGFTRDCLGCRPGDALAAHLKALRHLLARELLREGVEVTLTPPCRFQPGEQSHVPLTPSPEAAGYREALIECGAVGRRYACVLPRRRALNPQKNWGPENWTRLCSLMASGFGLSVVVLGGGRDTEHLEQFATPDLPALAEDRKLDINIAMLEGARFAVGSEGGGLFLSLLCGTPTFMFGHEVWTDRLTREENFLDTPCLYLGRPDNEHGYDEVAAALMSFAGEHGDAEGGGRATGVAVPDLRRDVAAHLAPDKVREAIEGMPHVPPGDREREWFTSPIYYPYFAAAASFARPRRILEVGTRLGYSLAAMYVGWPEVERIVSVDDESADGASQRKAEANLRSLGFGGEAEFLMADSHEALRAVSAYERFDLVHLDADQKAEEALQTMQLAWDLVLPGGYMIVDDVKYIAGVGSSFESCHRALRDCRLTEVLDTYRGLGVLGKEEGPPPPASSEYRCVLCNETLEPLLVKDSQQVLTCTACGLAQLAFPDADSRREWLAIYRDGGRYHREYQMAGHASFVHRYLHDRRLARVRMENLVRLAAKGRLLDVGCSNGALVRTAQEYGFTAEGIDPDPWVIEQAGTMTGCKCHVASLEEFRPERKYDVVTAIDVVEHFLDPGQALNKVRGLLKARGLLVIETPDAAEPGFRRMGCAWKHLKPREHAYYFGRAHMERLLTEHGFRLVDTIVPYPDRRVYYARKA